MSFLVLSSRTMPVSFLPFNTIWNRGLTCIVENIFTNVSHWWLLPDLCGCLLYQSGKELLGDERQGSLVSKISNELWYMSFTNNGFCQSLHSRHLRLSSSNSVPISFSAVCVLMRLLSRFCNHLLLRPSAAVKMDEMYCTCRWNAPAEWCITTFPGLTGSSRPQHLLVPLCKQASPPAQ